MNNRATTPDKTKDHSSTVSPNNDAIGAAAVITTLAESGILSTT